MFREIQMGAVAKSYMRKGFLHNIWGNAQYLVLYEEAFSHFSHLWLCKRSFLDFLLYEEFFFYQVRRRSYRPWKKDSYMFSPDHKFMFMLYMMYTRRRRKKVPKISTYLDTVDLCNSCYCILSLMSSHPKNAIMGGGGGIAAY